eukprot:GGOE01063170.1.p2 GENE.GGOE01063170.1~~GGOE01063170.1.p2  ORF type:complete len:515 (-),score=116.68 GGOE01063170.1:676-2157(-)
MPPRPIRPSCGKAEPCWACAVIVFGLVVLAAPLIIPYSSESAPLTVLVEDKAAVALRTEPPRATAVGKPPPTRPPLDAAPPEALPEDSPAHTAPSAPVPAAPFVPTDFWDAAHQVLPEDLQSRFQVVHTPSPSHPQLLWLRDVVHKMQNPSAEQCSKAKFLVYSAVSSGIGSMAHNAASAFAAAVCTGRILHVMPFPSPWASAPCNPMDGWLGCYFQPVSNCSPPGFDFNQLPFMTQSSFQALTSVKMVRANNPQAGFQSTGPCVYCGYHAAFPFPRGGIYDQLQRDFHVYNYPAVGILLRHLLQPKPWFVARLQEFLAGQRATLAALPPLFASMHVRYGDKISEAAPKALAMYMSALQRKRANLTDVFLSTETESAISRLRAQYPKHRFHAFKYQRFESPSAALGQHAVKEFIASFANLITAMHADFFVGTFSSNWCRLLAEMERSRLDGGREYVSLDAPSMPICFPDNSLGEQFCHKNNAHREPGAEWCSL